MYVFSLTMNQFQTQARIGGELWFQTTLSVRAGYAFKHPAQSYSLGAGLKFQPTA